MRLHEVLLVNDVTTLFDILQPCSPRGIGLEGSWIADHNETSFGTCDGHVEPTVIVEESNLASRIRSDRRKDNHIFLSSLTVGWINIQEWVE